MNKTSGIYQIKNTVNGKIYIGSSQDLLKRKRGHFNALYNGKHCNNFLQNAYNKYGKEFFLFTVLEECEIDILIEREQIYLDRLQSYKQSNGYNIRSIAESNRGWSPSEETRRRMGKAQKGNKNGLGNKNWLGKKHSDETKKKMSRSNKRLNAKLCEQNIPDIRKMYAEGSSCIEISIKYGVHRVTISDIINKRSWIYIPE